MYTDIIKQFDHMNKRIEASEVIDYPWPHMYITEVFTPDFYRTVSEFSMCDLLNKNSEYNRDQYTWNTNLAEVMDNFKEYDSATNRLFHTIAKKFNKDYDKEYVPCTTNFWADYKDLEINDIHIDAFYDTKFTISGQVYLPEDTNYLKYGTRLFRYIGNEISCDAEQDPGTDFPHTVRPDNENKFELVKTIPYMPNCMLITTNDPGSWHQAPIDIDADYIRRSVMFRWKV